MIGERLAKARKMAGLTQQDLADLVGLTYKSVSSYERDEYEPKDEYKKIFAETLNISLDYLLGLTDEPIALNRENNYALPANFPHEARTELNKFVDYLMSQFNQSENR